MAHYSSCIWYIVGFNTLQSTGESWLSYPEDYSNESNFDNYIHSFYFFITIMTSVGYGNIYPVNIYERVLCTALMFLSSGLFSYIIGSICIILNPQEVQILRELEQKYKIANIYLKNKDIKLGIRLKVKNYFEYLLTIKKSQNLSDNQINMILHDKIKGTINYSLYIKFLQQNMFFIHNNYIFKRLVEYVTETSLGEKELIFNKNDKGECLYYINYGQAIIYDPITKLIFKKLKVYNCLLSMAKLSGK